MVFVEEDDSPFL